MEIAPKVLIPFDVTTAFKLSHVYAAVPESSDDAENFFHFITRKTNAQESLVITIVFKRGEINYHMYIEKTSFYGNMRLWPFGYIQSGFNIGYHGSGPTALRNALETLVGKGNLPKQIEISIFGGGAIPEDGTIIFQISPEEEESKN
jgi:hypothetical protein